MSEPLGPARWAVAQRHRDGAQAFVAIQESRFLDGFVTSLLAMTVGA
jgi:hypothetical protein